MTTETAKPARKPRKTADETAKPARKPRKTADEPDEVTDDVQEDAAEPDEEVEEVEEVESLEQWNQRLDTPPEEPQAPLIGARPTEVGQFVGIGCRQVTRSDGEWAVDPETGLVTALLAAPADPEVAEAEPEA